MPGPSIINFVDVTVVLDGATTATATDFGRVMICASHSVTAARQEGPFASLKEAEDAGFTAAATPTIHDMITAVFSQSVGVRRVWVGRRDAGDTDFADALAAIDADPASDDWYLTLLDATDAADATDQLSAATWAESQQQTKRVIICSSDTAIPDGTPGNIAESVQSAAYRQTSVIFASSTNIAAGERVDAAWTSYCGGFKLDSPGGAGAWSEVQLAGVSPEPLTSAQFDQIRAYDATAYGQVRGLPFVGIARTGAGTAIEDQVTQDWARARLEERLLTTLVTTYPKVPYTSGGINLLATTAQGVLDLGVTAGHFSPDFPARVIAPDIVDVQPADKVNKLLRLQAEATLAGSIEKVEIVLNLEL